MEYNIMRDLTVNEIEAVNGGFKRKIIKEEPMAVVPGWFHDPRFFRIWPLPWMRPRFAANPSSTLKP
jgi:hypothetical protein